MSITAERPHESLGPEFNAPQIHDEHLDGAPHGERLGDVEGLHYWAQDVGPILDSAEDLAHRVVQHNSHQRHQPKWVTSILQGRAELEKGAQRYQKWTMNDTRIIEKGGIIEGEVTVEDSIESWYRRLGPTNDAEDLAPFLVRAVDHLENASNKRRHRLLAGNMLEDAALRTGDDKQRFQLLDEAQHRFDAAIGKEPDLTDEDTRESIRRSIDCEAMKQQVMLANGLIDSDTFYKHFEDLQTRNIDYLSATLDIPEHHMGSGELLEWASLIFLRHRRWSNETAEDFVIRDALKREDEALYPWGLDHGNNPGWSYDVVETNAQNPAQVMRLQLKVGKFHQDSERFRSYLPSVVRRVTSNIEGQDLQDLVSHSISAIGNTYKDIRHPELGIKIDEQAIEEAESLLPASN